MYEPIYPQFEIPIDTIQGIYQIYNKANQKSYVGSSINIKGRYKQHLNLLKRNAHDNEYMQSDWNKYKSKNFTFKILEVVNDGKYLIGRESFYVKKLRSLTTIWGYNKTIPIGGSTWINNCKDFILIDPNFKEFILIGESYIYNTPNIWI